MKNNSSGSGDHAGEMQGGENFLHLKAMSHSQEIARDPASVTVATSSFSLRPWTCSQTANFEHSMAHHLVAQKQAWVALTLVWKAHRSPLQRLPG